MLYPLEEEGSDKKAIQEFILGDKKEFFALTVGRNFVEQLEQDFLGNPINPVVSDNNLLEAHPKGYSVKREDSLYLIKNDKIEGFFEVQRAPNEQEQILERLEANETPFIAVAAAAEDLMRDMENNLRKDTNRDNESR